MILLEGRVYFTSIQDLDNQIMGVVLRRMCWKPWRWSVQPFYYKGVQIEAGHNIKDVVDGEAVNNLTLLGAVGMMKLMGIKHKEFETFEGELK